MFLKVVSYNTRQLKYGVTLSLCVRVATKERTSISLSMTVLMAA